MAGYYALLGKQPGIASIAGALQAGGLTGAQRQQRQQFEAEQKRLRDQFLAGRTDAEERGRAGAQKEAERVRANKLRYAAEWMKRDPDGASAWLRAQGLEPDAANVTLPGGEQIGAVAVGDMAATARPGQLSAELEGEAAGVLGVQKQAADRTTPDIVEFEKAHPELVGTPRYGAELEKWIRYRSASKSGGDDTSTKLRKELQSLPIYKETQTIATAFEKIRTASSTGPGDIGLIFGYMKMLDPNSTVREGEFATAENAGGVPGKVWNLYNKIVAGERLPESVRGEFKTEAGKLFDVQRNRFESVAGEYKRLARQAGLSPRDVVLDPGFRPVATDKEIDDELRELEGGP